MRIASRYQPVFAEDRMHRTSRLVGLAVVLIVPIQSAIGQGKPSTTPKIANAMTAAPRSLSGKATIMDWPASEGGQMVTLVTGTNGWTCFPDNPATKGNDPMCVDDQVMQFMKAHMTKSALAISRVGIGYMLAPGGGYGSNKDPYATKATPDNEWGFDPPRVVVMVPDKRALEGLPTTRQSGGPWVMWAGTEYAHIMVPIASVK
jgi:hypothetical protein